jgi:hypothetical protein
MTFALRTQQLSADLVRRRHLTFYLIFLDAISLRTGAVDSGWLLATATAMAHLLQQGTPREAEDTATRVGRLPYSRSSFDRVGHAVGQLYAEKKTAIDDALIVALEIPTQAQAVSFGLDRVSLPLEEPRPRPVGRPRRDAPKRPAQRVSAWRTARRSPSMTRPGRRCTRFDRAPCRAERGSP